VFLDTSLPVLSIKGCPLHPSLVRCDEIVDTRLTAKGWHQLALTKDPPEAGFLDASYYNLPPLRERDRVGERVKRAGYVCLEHELCLAALNFLQDTRIIRRTTESLAQYIHGVQTA
jgi:hypothetical protein